MKIDCKHCGRFLFDAVGTTIIEGIICPNSKCKARMNFKIIFNTDTLDSQIHQQMNAAETRPKSLVIMKDKE